MRGALLLGLALVALPATASHRPLCPANDAPTVGMWELNLGAADVYYVDDHNALLGWGTYVYQESNGVFVDRGPGVYGPSDDVTRHNLQRGGSSPLVPNDNSVCVDDPGVVPDLMWF